MEQKLINTVVGDFSQLNRFLSEGWVISEISAHGSGCYVLLEKSKKDEKV